MITAKAVHNTTITVRGEFWEVYRYTVKKPIAMLVQDIGGSV
jgi:hypothetical protein